MFFGHWIRNHKVITLVGSIVVLGVIFGGVWFANREQPTVSESEVPWVMFDGSSKGMNFSYPSTASISALSAEDEETGIFFRITLDDPRALFSIRREDSLGVLKLTGGTILDALVDSVNRQYPTRFPGYQKEKYEEPIIANEKAALFEFTYVGTDQLTRMKQRLVIIVRDNVAYFISGQTEAAQFDRFVPTLDRIVQGIQFVEL
ncbi:MAG: hypothetical protein HYZ08_01910 [Candidatus Kerfeldbacteria bacterium]|nr:hypothetical protein [Candidatus Kerfeldbacteria bacterium]